MADGTLIFDTKLDSSGVETGVSKLGSVMGGIGKTACVGMATAVAAVGTAAVGTTKAVIDGAMATAEYGDNIDKMSQKIGMSAEAYQEWDFILQQNGADVDMLQASMKTLSTAADNNKDAFQRLGISEEFVKSASPEELFGEVITQLQGMEEGTERTAIASQLLGKSATELAPLLNSGAEATEELRKQAHEYGMVMSDESVKASAAFQDSLNVMQQTLNGLKNKTFAEFLPALTQVTDGLGKLFAGDMSGLDDINAGIQSFVDTLSSAIPQILEIGMSILKALAEAIIQNLPMLIETGLQIIMQIAMAIAQALPTLIPTMVETILAIVEYLIENVDLLIDAAIQIIIALAEGIVNSLPILIEKAPVIIEKLLVALVTNIPKLLEAAVKVIETLATGLITNIPKLLSKVPQIMTSLKNAFLGLCSGFADVGKNIIDGLWNGIQSGWSWLTDKVKNLASSLLDAAKGALGIQSPSKEFRKIGEFCVAGFDKGIDGLMDGNALASDINASLGTIQANVNGANGGIGGGFTQVINVNREISTPDELARAVRLESRYGLMKGVALA